MLIKGDICKKKKKEIQFLVQIPLEAFPSRMFLILLKSYPNGPGWGPSVPKDTWSVFPAWAPLLLVD